MIVETWVCVWWRDSTVAGGLTTPPWTDGPTFPMLLARTLPSWSPRFLILFSVSFSLLYSELFTGDTFRPRKLIILPLYIMQIT